MPLAPLRSRWTKAESVYHVRGLGDGDAPTSPTKDTRLPGVGCRPKLGVAQNRCWIGLKHWINCDNGQPVFEGLTHQYPVKRVPVDRRQGRELGYRTSLSCISKGVGDFCSPLLS